MPRRLPVSNESAMQAVKVSELPGVAGWAARDNGWAVLDLEPHNPAQKAAPTLLLMREGDGFLFVKLLGEKRTAGDPDGLTSTQREWVDYVEACGGEVLLARPGEGSKLVDRLRRPASEQP